VSKIINSEKKLYDHIEYLRTQFKEHGYLRTDTKTGKQRTNLQNASLHLYCEQIAGILKEKGITFKLFFKPGFEVPWTMDIVKDNIWRPVQIAVCREKSTTKPLTTEYPVIYDSINLKLSEFEIHVPWPSKESLKLANKDKL